MMLRLLVALAEMYTDERLPIYPWFVLLERKRGGSDDMDW